MGSQQPPLQQCDHTVYARKQMLSLFLRALYLTVMNISLQSQIGIAAVTAEPLPQTAAA
jgi:hypothetical protein